MVKMMCVMVAGLWTITGVAFASGVDVNMNVNVGHPAPQVRVVEKETVVVKEKKDNGKHLGQYKEKAEKRKRRKTR